MLFALSQSFSEFSKAPWDTATLGVPINQEDMVGTLMTFTWLILDGLAKLGNSLTPEDQQAYFETWLVVGRLMGVDADLLPATVADARALTALIEQRQIAESPQGREMMAALQLPEPAQPSDSQQSDSQPSGSQAAEPTPDIAA